MRGSRSAASFSLPARASSLRSLLTAPPPGAWTVLPAAQAAASALLAAPAAEGSVGGRL